MLRVAHQLRAPTRAPTGSPPRCDHRGRPRGLAEVDAGRRGQLVGERPGRSPRAPGPARSRSPRWSITARKPATPIATFTRPRRKARPWVSVTTTPTRPPTAAAIAGLQAPRRSVGVDRQQHHRALGHVRGVDAGVRADEAVVGLADHRPAAPADDPPALGEDQLAQRGRLAGLLGEGAGGRARGAPRPASTSRPSALLTTFWATISTSPGDDALGARRARRASRRGRRRARTSGSADSGQSLRGRSRPRAAPAISSRAQAVQRRARRRRAPSAPPGRAGCRCRGRGRGARRR